MYLVGAVLLIAALTKDTSAQRTAQKTVAPILRECYSDPLLLNRNNLPPTTIPVLIDIIRQLENHPNINVDLRQMSTMLLHNYRQDGIVASQTEQTNMATSFILPFAANHESFYRHRLLLTHLIPDTMRPLENDTLPPTILCGLHHMLSTTIDSRIRNDESMCNQLSQYRALRVPRDASIDEEPYEILDKHILESANKNGQMIADPDDEVEFNGIEGAHMERQTRSECPIHGGVVHTTWGAVSGGNLIAGIAAGAQPQRIPISKLNTNLPSEQSTVFNIFGATVSGDLAEASLMQGTRTATRISVGAAGGWNSTEAQRFHMLQSTLHLEMTDPEIRGGIDGLVLGTNLPNILSVFGQLRLSQLLDMYYNARNGVFDSNLRACNRQMLSTQFLDTNTLNRETVAFAMALESYLPLPGTITDGLADLVSSAVQNLETYVSNNLNDVSCVATVASAPDFRVRINLYLAIDSSWSYDTIYPAVSHLLNSIEVGRFDSSVTLLSAFDGSILINTTFSLAEFHSAYTLQRHQTLIPGVNLLSVFTNVRSRMLEELTHERERNYVGGNSTVLLFLLNAGNINTHGEVWEEVRAINDTIPDLRILFATSTNQHDALWSLVRDMHNDIEVLSLSSNGANIDQAMAPIRNRVRSVGRRIINPNCGSEWNENISGSHHFIDFVEPDYINFYTVSPNYFYQDRETRRVRITRNSAGLGNLIVCHSRVVEQPRQNATANLGLPEGAIQCATIGTGTGEVEIPIRNFCNDFWTINTCPPLYISVQSVTPGTTDLTAVCTENACRFPYSLRYQVGIEDFGCFSGAVNIAANITFILAALIVIVLRLN